MIITELRGGKDCTSVFYQPRITLWSLTRIGGSEILHF